MNTLRITALCIAMLLLITSEPAAAQSKLSSGDRSERRSEGDMSRRNGAETRRADDPGAQPAAPPGGVASPGRPGTMEDGFNVLLQRSIFARNGAAVLTGQPATTASTAPATPVLSPEQAVLFVGVLAQDEEYVAFAENQTTQQLMTLRAGDDVARGKIVAITLDTIAYGAGGSIKEIHLGQNLAGEVVSSSYTTGGSTTAPAAAAPSTAGLTPEQAAVMERLRQRRQRGE